jgi:hypothetical protein
MKLSMIQILDELFGGEYTYPLTVKSDETYHSEASKRDYRSIRYHFITKDNVEYDVLLGIYEDGNARMDFNTRGLSNADHSSIIDLINTHDSIKVFNTLKSILNKHREEIKHLSMDSTPDRIEFYKKILNHLHINYKQIYPNHIIADL